LLKPSTNIYVLSLLCFLCEGEQLFALGHQLVLIKGIERSSPLYPALLIFTFHVHR